MALSFRKRSSGRSAIYLSNLFISFHYFIVIYINSAFLSKFVDIQTLSILYLVGSVLSALLFFTFAKIVKRVGNYYLTLIFTLLEMLALLGLATAPNSGIIIVSFILYLTVSPIIYLNLDIFLEKLTATERITGGVRGMFLTMQNIAQVFAPLFVGLFLYEIEYWRIYAISIGFLAIATYFIAVRLKNFNDPHYHSSTLRQSFSYILKHPSLYNVIAAQSLLRFFYAWMVIYTPLYLFQEIGFPWPTIGIMFSIMLLPFLALELPLGRIADSQFGEKEIMIFGFFLMVISVAIIPFLTTPVFITWTAVLFFSRIGAASVDIATESYFFKNVDGSLVDTISLFRVSRPTTYIAAAGIAALSLQFLSLQWSFFVLAAIVALGLPYAFALRDTK